jgi:hypothetical protein
MRLGSAVANRCFVIAVFLFVAWAVMPLMPAGAADFAQTGATPGQTGAPLEQTGEPLGQTGAPLVESGVPAAQTAESRDLPAAPLDSPVLQQVELRSERTLLRVGDTVRLSLAGTMSTGQPADLTVATVVYGSSAPTVAAVSETGLVTAMGAGTADITASITIGGTTVSDTIHLTVESDTGEYRLVPVADTYVQAGQYANDNFGSDVYLRVKTHTDPNHDSNRYAYLKFDLTPVAGNILSAELYLSGRIAEAERARTDLFVSGVGDVSWEETAVTWNTKPALTQRIATVSIQPTSGDQWYGIDVTNYVKEQTENGEKIVSFGLHDSVRQIRFLSREGDAAPYLKIITGTPELKEVHLSAEQTKLGLSDRIRLELKAVMSDGSEGDLSQGTVRFESSNADVAAVDSQGNVIPLKAGTTVLTAIVTMGGVTLSDALQVTVVNYSHVIRLKAAEDAYVRAGNYKDVNHDDEEYLRVKLRTEGSEDDANRQTFIKFDLNPIRDSILSAKLYLYGGVADNPQTDTDITVYPVIDDGWSEKTVTWNTKPELGDEPLSTIRVTAASGTNVWREMDVTAFIQEQYTGDRIASLGLYDSVRQFRAASRNQAGYEPYLEVLTYDPLSTPILADVELFADKIDLGIGETARLTVIATMTNGAAADPSIVSVTYESDNPAVATVDAQGIVTAVGEGRAGLKAVVTVGDITMEDRIDIAVSRGETFVPSDDAFVRDGADRAVNFGGDEELRVRRAATADGGNAIAYMRFDLSRIDGYVADAKLYVYGYAAVGDPDFFDVYGVEDRWDESQLTWNNRPAFDDGDRISKVYFDRTKKWREIDVTDYIRTQVWSDGVAAIAIHREAESSADVRINSKDNVAFHPYLKVRTEDIAPATLALTTDRPFAEIGRNASPVVTVRAVGADKLKAFVWNFTYPADLLQLESAELDDAFGRYRSTARVSFTDDNGQVRIAGGLLGDQEGKSGDFPVLHLRFRTKGKDGKAHMEISGGAANRPSAELVITRADLTGGGVAIDDLTAVARAYGTKAGDAGYDAKLDLNKDGIVDRQDLQYEAEFVFHPDFVAPVIRLDQSDATVGRNEFTVSGTVSKPAVVKVNGMEVPVADDLTFRTEVVLAERETAIRVEAADALGNEAEPAVIHVELTGKTALIVPENTVVGRSPKYVGFNQGHYMPGSNTSAWVERTGINAMRFWAAPQLYVMEEDIDAGSGVTDIASFDARKAALRSNPLDKQFINWDAVSDRLHHSVYPGTNKYIVGYVLQEFKRLNIAPIAMLNNNDWGGSWADNWRQWQKYYAMAFLLARDGDVEMFQFLNEPNHSNAGVTQAQYIQGLKISSDAIRAAVEDVNRLYGKSLKVRMIAPVTAGSPEGPWGQISMRNIRTDYHEQTVDYNIFDIFANQQYSQTGNFYANQIEAIRNMMRTHSPTGEVLPIMYSEFGRYTTATYATIPETLDTPYIIRDVGGIYGATMEHGVYAMIAFKFSNTVTSQYPEGYKSGHHYVWNEGVYDIGGERRTAEVVRLFAKGFKDEKELYRTPVYSVDKDYKAYTSYDPDSGNYYMWLVQPSDTDPYHLTIDLSGLDVDEGTVVTVEEASGSRYGEVVHSSVVPKSKQLAFTQPKQSVWLVTIPKGKALAGVKLAPVADAQVQGGALAGSNFGGLNTIGVRLRTGAPQNNQLGYLKFTLDDANPAETKRAILQVYGDLSDAGRDFSFHVYGLLDDGWEEASLTWNNAPDLDAAAGKMRNVGISAFPVGILTIGADGYGRVDVTEFVRKHPDRQITFVLVREHRFAADRSDDDQQAFIHSRESGEPAKRPQLFIWRQ